MIKDAVDVARPGQIFRMSNISSRSCVLKTETVLGTHVLFYSRKQIPV